MTPSGEHEVPHVVRSAIQSRHPGIADEIHGAIQTLRKLQDIAGLPGNAPPAEGDASQGSIGETTGGTLSPPAADNDDATNILAEAPDSPEVVAAVPLLKAGCTFGRYQIVRRLGRGAMGAVYLAYDTQLHRHVALKTPFLGRKPNAVERFFREAQAAAQLRSPYLCPIYDVGQIGGVYFFSMAFIDGQPLSRAIAEKRLDDLRSVAALVQKVARGMHKAHEQGIIHRDLKPDNIMVDADGEPIVTDFGLARKVDDDVRITLPGRILGTPAYMSPEQVDGEDNVGPASDIYSLGVVLYELIAGSLPFKGSMTSVLRQVASAEPARPSSRNPALGENSPLERICLKMMAKLPAHRYACMAEAAEALDEVLSPVRQAVEQPSLWQRLFSWMGRFSASRASKRPSIGAPAAVPASGPVEKTLRTSDPVTPAGAPARESVDKTVRSSDPVTPAMKKGRQMTEQTTDLPLSHSTSEKTMRLSDPAASDEQKDRQMTQQTTDLPLSHSSS
jgi:serine/threonine protein kinase